ncbi:MAG TPA: HAD family phosphatase [Longimicrobiaceae bacterium]|nr:HAD family phosphatase [Longimicrobiaceae bacterium]
MREVRALLFDLDGTLVDTGAANYAAYARALAEVGVAVEPEAFAEVAGGRNWRQFLPELLGRAGVAADPAAVARRKRDLYPEMIGGLRLNEPLLALAASSRAVMRTALVTTASASNVHAILRRYGLAELFEVVVTGDDVARHKPDPEAYLEAVSRLALSPEECLAFEDSQIGIASARAAGVPVVHVAFGA